jgi:hypothetical protein
MAVWRYVDFSVKEAQWLADLASIQSDLETVQSVCDLFIKERQGPDPFGESKQLVLFEALCTAAIVRYGRSFVSGVREKVPEGLIEQLSQEHQASHGFFMDLRHKWIAHSVNRFESTQVVAYLTPPERGPKSVSSISALPNRIASLSSQDMLRLKDLAVAVRQIISKQIEEEKQKVLSFARSLPPDDFYVQSDPPVKLAGDTDAGKQRKKW